SSGLGPLLDDCDVLSKRIVHLIRGAPSLILLRLNQLPRKCCLQSVLRAKSSNPAFVTRECHQCQGYKRDEREPPRLPERRQHHDINSLSDRIPHALRVGCRHSEFVFPRRNTKKTGGPAVACVNPLVIQAIQSVSKSELIRFNEARCSKADLENRN